MAQVKLSYWKRLWNALTGASDPQPVFGLDDAWRVLTSPNMSKYEQAGGETAEIIATTQMATVIGFSNAKVTVGEDIEESIAAKGAEIEGVEAETKALKAELDDQIAALEAAKVQADVDAKEAIIACTDDLLPAVRVQQFFKAVLKQ